MHIVHHPLCSNTVHASDDIQVSFWKPSPQELESLITGGGVELQIRALGHQHPIVSVATWPAIGPDLVDGDPFMQRTTGYRCFQCCAKEGVPHDEHCINVMRAIKFAHSNRKPVPDSCEPEGPPLSNAPTVSAVLKAMFAFKDLPTGPMAAIFRAAGYKIAERWAAEEAFILDRMIRAVLTHGDEWARVFAGQLRVAQDAAIEKHEAAARSGQKKSA
jgi:hypothetical protein